MSMLEVIDEIKHNLEEMREAKQGIKKALEDKFKKPVGDDFTKYPKKIDEIWAENEKIKVLDGYRFFGGPDTYRPIWDFSNCQNIEQLCFNSRFPTKPFETKIEIPLRQVTNYNKLFDNVSVDVRDYIQLVGIPQNSTNFGNIHNTIFAYYRKNPSLDNLYVIDEEKDLKGKTFQLTEVLARTNCTELTKIPDFIEKIWPYSTEMNNINYYSSNKTLTLIEDLNLEFCKEKDLESRTTGSVFHNITFPNSHFYFYHNFYFNTENGFFTIGKCDGTIRLDGPGCLIITGISKFNNHINRIGNSNFEGNRLEIKFKVNTNIDQDFSNFKYVEFLEGTEFYSVSNLPYKTQEEWAAFFKTLPDNSESTYENIIKISSDYYNLLTEDDIFVATDKGFTIQSV